MEQLSPPSLKPSMKLILRIRSVNRSNIYSAARYSAVTSSWGFEPVSALDKNCLGEQRTRANIIVMVNTIGERFSFYSIPVNISKAHHVHIFRHCGCHNIVLVKLAKFVTLPDLLCNTIILRLISLASLSHSSKNTSESLSFLNLCLRRKE